MATRIKSSQIADGTIVASDLHSAIAVNTTAAGTFGSVIVDDITLDGTSISTPSSMMLNVGGNLTIDVDGTYITLADDGNNWGQFYNSQQNFYINNPTANKDIIFRGVKAGTPNTTVTALTLDMSNDGRATFNENVSVGGVISTSDTTGSTNTTSGALTVAGGIGIAENAYIGGNVIVTGDLTVEGSQVTLNTTALDVEDKNITLNYHASNDTSASADGAGITIQDAVDASTDASILWNTTSSEFDFSHDIHVDTILTDTGIVHSGDTDTYIKFLSDRIYIDVGSNRVFDAQAGDVSINGPDGSAGIKIDTGGNVGIGGINNPGNLLHVQSTVNNGGVITI